MTWTPDRDKDPLELWLSRRRFLAGLAAAAGIAVVVKADRPTGSPHLAGRPGTRWIGHC
jgi:hypothetical protein